MFIKFHDKQKCLGASPDISRVTLQLLKRSTHHSPSLANPNGGEPDILSDRAEMLSKQRNICQIHRKYCSMKNKKYLWADLAPPTLTRIPCQSNLLRAQSLVNNLPIPIKHLLHLLLFLQSTNQTLGISICISV